MFRRFCTYRNLISLLFSVVCALNYHLVYTVLFTLFYTSKHRAVISHGSSHRARHCLPWKGWNNSCLFPPPFENFEGEYPVLKLRMPQTVPWLSHSLHPPGTVTFGIPRDRLRTKCHNGRTNGCNISTLFTKEEKREHMSQLHQGPTLPPACHCKQKLLTDFVSYRQISICLSRTYLASRCLQLCNASLEASSLDFPPSVCKIEGRDGASPFPPAGSSIAIILDNLDDKMRSRDQ